MLFADWAIPDLMTTLALPYKGAATLAGNRNEVAIEISH